MDRISTPEARATHLQRAPNTATKLEAKSLFLVQFNFEVYLCVKRSA